LLHQVGTACHEYRCLSDNNLLHTNSQLDNESHPTPQSPTLFVKIIKIQTDLAPQKVGSSQIETKLEVFTNNASWHSRYTIQSFRLSYRDVL